MSRMTDERPVVEKCLQCGPCFVCGHDLQPEIEALRAKVALREEEREQFCQWYSTTQAQLTALRDGLNTVIFEWRRNFISGAEAMCRIGGLLTQTAPDVNRAKVVINNENSDE